jgi:hypothetical protein
MLRIRSHLEEGAIMVRLVTTVLALAILPGFAVAQEPDPDAYLVHVVVPGNTLWDLAERYYGDAFAWPRIREANRSQILDPDLICPDQQFQIPDVPRPDATAVALIDWTPTLICPGLELMIPVTAGVEDVLPGPEIDADAAPGVVSDVVVTTTVVGPPPPEARVVRRGISRDRRSVFYRDPNAISVSQMVEEEEYVLFSRTSVWSAEWLGPEVSADVQSSGRLQSFVAQNDMRTGIPYTQVRLTLEPGTRVRLGDALQIFRPVRTARGLGTIFRPTGVLSITRVEAGSVEGVILQSFDRVQLGDQIRTAPAYDLVPGQVPGAVARCTSATIIEFRGVHELYGLQEVVMIDKGAADGVDVGDEYVAFAGDGVTEQAVARMRVVLTENSTSSARIVGMVEPVFQSGAEVHLDRKMR